MDEHISIPSSTTNEWHNPLGVKKTGRDNGSTCHNSVTKGEFLSLAASGTGLGISGDHHGESAIAL